MKRYLITGILAISILTVYSQAKFELGLKGGLNLANMSSDFDATYESRTGYHLGAYSLIKIASIGIQPELLYSAQGTTYTFSSINQDLQRDLKYFTIPVMLKFYLPLGINLQAGPQFGFLVNAEGDSYTVNGNDDITIQTGQDLKNELNNSDISVALGAGWDFPFGLNIAARYLIGINEVHQSEENTKNRVFQVSVGFRLFKLGN